jgi:hypothetical protein
MLYQLSYLGMPRAENPREQGRHGAKWGEFIGVDIAAEAPPDLSARGRPPHLENPKPPAAKR